MQKVHMLGIGGAGMAALAVMLKDMGALVSGSDREESDTAKRLLAAGIPIDFSNRPDRLQKADLCVYSAALSPAHPLLQYAKKHMPTYSRGEMMGSLSAGFSTVAAVAGTHGKTTTCGMLTTILLFDNQDPSVLMGGHLSAIGGNGRLGSRDLLVCEACEFAGSFLHLKRDVGILLNIDNDHLECYGSMEGLKEAFSSFTKPCKTAIVCAEDDIAMQVTKDHPQRLCYGLDHRCHCYATHLQQRQGCYSFLLHLPDRTIHPIHLSVRGKHNLFNALAAATAAWYLKASPSAIKKGLQAFHGVARRFELVCQEQGITVIDDYAHHPAEIQSVLDTASTMDFSRIIAVFQPFTYSRTLALHKEFAQALSSAHRVILPPIMGGREPKNNRVTSHLIATHLENSVVCANLSHAAKLALHEAKPGDLILTMGCGNVYRCAKKIAQLLKQGNVHEKNA